MKSRVILLISIASDKKWNDAAYDEKLEGETGNEADTAPCAFLDNSLPCYRLSLYLYTEKWL